jgi:hypothetical protein
MRDSFDLTLACLDYAGEQAKFDGMGVVMAVYQGRITVSGIFKAEGK